MATRATWLPRRKDVAFLGVTATLALLIVLAAPLLVAWVPSFLAVGLLAYPALFISRGLERTVYTTTVATLAVCLFVAHYYRLALTAFPLMTSDILIFTRTPSSSLNALFIPKALQYLLFAALVLWAMGLGGVLARAIWRRPARLVLVTCWVALIGLYIAPFGPYIAALRTPSVTGEFELWDTSGVERFARRLGPPDFLLYTAWLDTGYQDALLTPQDIPGDPQMLVAGAEHLPEVFPLTAPGERTAPNIMLVLLESTFDPNDVFQLEAPFVDPLFEPGMDTHARGLLRVNTVGGGTWISEFEALTGLDTRLFGFRGYHTHVTLSPFIDRSFVRYAAEHGYMTEAFYGTEGDFFDARNAFPRYGFHRFLEKADLGLTAPAWGAKDTEIADAVIGMPLIDPDKPFFRFVVTLENHSPHPCDNFGAAEEFVVTFRNEADFALNCTLNEYLLRLRSTSQAVDRLHRHLRELEAATGRPYVLAVFGDHQPHSFIGSTGGPLQSFDHVRTQPDPRRTFFHVLSSVGHRPFLWPQGEMAPLTLLPTLLSAYIARDVGDLYLPANFLAFRECGPDLLGTPPTTGLYTDEAPPPGTEGAGPLRTCLHLPALLASYRSSGVIRLD